MIVAVGAVAVVAVAAAGVGDVVEVVDVAAVLEVAAAAVEEVGIAHVETVAVAVGGCDTVTLPVCGLCCYSQLLRPCYSWYVHSHKVCCKHLVEERL